MNQKNTSSVPMVFSVGVIASAVMALIASVLYGIAYHTSYDTVMRHFNTGAVLPTVFGVLMLLSAVTFTVASIIMRKKYTVSDRAPGSVETFALWLCGLMFLIFGFISLASGTKGTGGGIGVFCTNALTPLAILSALPLFLRTSNRLRNSTVHGAVSFVPVLWGICLLFKYYFDLKEMPLNDPELTLTMVSISCAVLFFLCECKTTLGMCSPALSVFTSSAAMCLTGSISAARLVLWRIDGHVIPAPTETLLLFAVAILAGSRLYELATSFVPAPPVAESDEAVQEEDDGSTAEDVAKLTSDAADTISEE